MANSRAYRRHDLLLGGAIGLELADDLALLVDLGHNFLLGHDGGFRATARTQTI